MWPDGHLTCDGAKADFVVDLSNVIWKASLGGDRKSDLRRFLSLIQALAEQIHDDDVKVCAIGDWSLVRKSSGLTDDETRTLKRWRNRGLIELYDEADPRILELADAFPALCVVSNDNYLDFHRIYPWLSDNRDRFFEAVPGKAGGVKVARRAIPVRPDWQLSRKEEETLLKKAGMYDGRGGARPRRALLARVWRCPAEECATFGAGSGDEQPLPLYRNGVVRCPTHNQPLADIGPRTPSIQLKVLVDGTTRARFTVRSGETVVGRAPDGPDGVALHPSWLSAEAVRGISRSHAALSWDGERLTVRDLSRNGTRVREARNSAPGQPIGPGGHRRLWRGQVVILYDGVELVVSGREFVFREDATGGEPLDPSDPGATSPTTVHQL